MKLMEERELDEQEGQDSGPAETLWDSERIVSDTVGHLMELWGFKRNMGRVWTVLYLAGQPLTARQLHQRLQLSTGAVSMTLAELARWGVVQKSWVQGDRRDFFEAEANLWKMISKVLKERETFRIDAGVERLAEARKELGTGGRGPESARRKQVSARIERLERLTTLVRGFIEVLVEDGKLDVSGLKDVSLDDER